MFRKSWGELLCAHDQKAIMVVHVCLDEYTMIYIRVRTLISGMLEVRKVATFRIEFLIVLLNQRVLLLVTSNFGIFTGIEIL